MIGLRHSIWVALIWNYWKFKAGFCRFCSTPPPLLALPSIFIRNPFSTRTQQLCHVSYVGILNTTRLSLCNCNIAFPNRTHPYGAFWISDTTPGFCCFREAVTVTRVFHQKEVVSNCEFMLALYIEKHQLLLPTWGSIYNSCPAFATAVLKLWLFDFQGNWVPYNFFPIFRLLLCRWLISTLEELKESLEDPEQ